MNYKSIEYIANRMGVTNLEQNGEWITISCPLAPWTHAGGTDRRPSFGIRESIGVSGANCFSCGFKGGVLNLVRQYGRYAIKDGIWSEEDLQEVTDYVILAEDEDELAKEQKIVKEVVVPVRIQDFLTQNNEYFETRGITEESVKKWNLGYVERYEDLATGTRLGKRVLFPVYVMDGKYKELKGVIGRAITNDVEPKYKNAPPSFKKADYLYGQWLVGDRRKIVVVEGAVDAIKVNQNLEKYKFFDMFAVALMGSSASKAQIEWLKGNADEVICLLDNDPSGKLGSKKLVEELDNHLIVSSVEWDVEHNDPDDAGEVVVTMINGRETVLESKLRRLLGH